MKTESNAKKPNATQSVPKQSVNKESADKYRLAERQRWEKARKALYEYWQDNR